MDVGNLISGSSAFSKSSLYIWKFSVHLLLKPSLKDWSMFFLASAMLCLVPQSCLILCDTMDYRPPDSSVYGDSPGKNTGVFCDALLQGIFPTQGSNHVSRMASGFLPSEPPGKPPGFHQWRTPHKDHPAEPFLNSDPENVSKIKVLVEITKFGDDWMLSTKKLK